MKGISHYFFFTFSCLFLLEKAREKRTKEGKKTALLSPYHPLSSLVQKEFENEHNHFPSYFSRLTPFFRNGNGRENLFFLLFLFLLPEMKKGSERVAKPGLLPFFASPHFLSFRPSFLSLFSASEMGNEREEEVHPFIFPLVIFSLS